jgi:glycosyltransferase involved in cell wall biosynthesis
MGAKKKKSASGNGQNQKNNKQIHTTPVPPGPNDHLPFVSICTPTFNRRPFWDMAIKCFDEYDYPKDRMEWIIIDDGSDKVEDLVSHLPHVKYYKYDEQMILGKKRNLMHDKARGDIIIYQDDDDYYPPDRVSHAVQTLIENPKALCAGSSIVFVYFKHVSQMYRFGPYGPNHATAGTFAFRRELLNQTRYNDDQALAEEGDFLKGYSIPFVQLDPAKTILVFPHIHNTCDKRELLVHAPNPTCNPDPDVTVNTILKNESIYQFFMEDIDGLLEEYSLGDPKYKMEVNKQLAILKENNQKRMETHQKKKQEEAQRLSTNNIVDAANNRVQEERGKAIRVMVQNKKLLIKLREYEKILGIEPEDAFTEEQPI